MQCHTSHSCQPAEWHLLLYSTRQVCNHPYLFNIDAEPDFDGMTTGEDIVESSGKMQVLDRLLRKLKGKGHRVVLFSQVCELLERNLGTCCGISAGAACMWQVVSNVRHRAHTFPCAWDGGLWGCRAAQLDWTCK